MATPSSIGLGGFSISKDEIATSGIHFDGVHYTRCLTIGEINVFCAMSEMRYPENTFVLYFL